MSSGFTAIIEWYLVTCKYMPAYCSNCEADISPSTSADSLQCPRCDGNKYCCCSFFSHCPAYASSNCTSGDVKSAAKYHYWQPNSPYLYTIICPHILYIPLSRPLILSLPLDRTTLLPHFLVYVQLDLHGTAYSTVPNFTTTGLCPKG